MFDNGVFLIADDFSLIGLEGQLTLNKKHKIEQKFLQYHREHYFEI
jgi:putative restriction endonuclease